MWKRKWVFSEHWVLCNMVLHRCHNCLHTTAHSASTDSAGAWVNKPAVSGSNFTSNGFLWFKIVKTVFQTSSRHSSPTFKQTWEQWWRKHCQNEWEREIDLCESDTTGSISAASKQELWMTKVGGAGLQFPLSSHPPALLTEISRKLIIKFWLCLFQDYV